MFVECLFVRDVAGAPACVDEFPFAVVDTNGVPGVVGFKGWDGVTWFEWCVAVAFAITINSHTFQTGMEGDGCKDPSVT